MTQWILRAIAFFGMLVLLVPLIVVIVNAFNADPLLSEWGGFTLRWIQEVLADPSVQQSAIGSFTIAAAVTLCSAVIGTLAVGFAGYAPKPLRKVTDFLTITRITLPEVILGAGLLVLISKLGIPFGNVAVIIGQTVWCSAYFITIAAARRAGSDHRLEEAARDLGAAPMRVFRTIVVPDLAPGILAGALITFTFSFDNVVTAVLLSGPDTRTLPLEILSRINHGINPAINAIGLLIMLVTVLSLGAMAAAGGIGPALLSSQKSKESVR